MFNLSKRLVRPTLINYKPNQPIKIKTIYHVTVRNCGEPGAVPNADRSGSEFTYLHNVTYTCHHGYRMTGSPIRTCQADGQWSAAPTCQRNYLIFYNNYE